MSECEGMSECESDQHTNCLLQSHFWLERLQECERDGKSCYSTVSRVHLPYPSENMRSCIYRRLLRRFHTSFVEVVRRELPQLQLAQSKAAQDMKLIFDGRR